MTAFIHHEDDQSLDATIKDTPKDNALAQARKRRVEALRRIAGIWANRTDIPADGLTYQVELRSEWR
ncbi:MULTISPECIES: hypothetical protein [unclassified Duganella]|uniref:hypothetical protein n=1 Tax=unclassified Duganella TaxID=2636909 RepID=UPI000E355C40|nr:MULTISPECIES: hypothetical protein [unclassified Duganella]RFP10134.1 hypothetical protein D0T23_24395 [Duganella sp. BJB475]RFP25560.1 hypothetical protein D0T21_26215 [Duganella sp. BJB476]